MPIRSQIQPNSETIQGFEAAAEEKFEDGFTLLADAHPGNGVYLMGIAAEMWLKSAYFRLRGFGFQQTITMKDLADAARRHQLTLSAEKYHDLEFWAQAIISQRHLNSLKNAKLEADLTATARRLNDNWFVGMRYHSLQGIARQDLEAVLDDVVWIKTEHTNLWT